MYRFTLYIAGDSASSLRAQTNLKRPCDDHLHGLCDFSVIDLRQQPQVAEDLRILATPMIVRENPPPIRRIIGDLSDLQRVLTTLELPLTKPQEQSP